MLTGAVNLLKVRHGRLCPVSRLRLSWSLHCSPAQNSRSMRASLRISNSDVSINLKRSRAVDKMSSSEGLRAISVSVVHHVAEGVFLGLRLGNLGAGLRAVLRAIATAWAGFLPAFISVRMFCETAAFDLPLIS